MSLKGCASPLADSGFSGTMRVQSGLGAAEAAAAGAAVAIRCACTAALPCSICADAAALKLAARIPAKPTPSIDRGVMAETAQSLRPLNVADNMMNRSSAVCIVESAAWGGRCRYDPTGARHKLHS